MRYLNKIKIKKKFLILCITLLIFSSLGSINSFYKSESNDSLTSNDEMEFNLNDVQFDQKSLPKWKEQNLKADKNENGIDDNFEVRLKQLSEFGFIEEKFDRDKENSGKNYIHDDIFRTDNQKTEKITKDDIPIIICFPNGDYDSISLLFQLLGGEIKSTYKAALNGFAGRIGCNPLNEFCDLLIQNDIPFFIEEDTVYEAQLYYTGRNMNLRPYVWNNLSYDGDEYSSIAIIDTGIDDSHNFTTPGYSDADFNYKIVGWRDEVNGLVSPYDDNGHGSHCSGISTGEGSPNYDGTGRTVATAAYEWNYTGLLATPGAYLFNWARFNVTEPGLIDLFCEFDDFTPGLDDVDFWAYLYYGETIVDSYEVTSDSWSHTLSYTTTSSSLGLYSFRYSMNLIDNTGDGSVSDFNLRFRSEMHWPFSPSLFGSGDAWKGVAPDAHLVGVKVLDQHGSGWSSDIIDGINWVITNKNVYNITTMSLSLGGGAGDTAFINAVNNAVENGIVTVVSAGNDGPGGNNIGSPGDADNVITVAAMNIYDETTSYSSQGGLSYTGNTVKPDITAPGGSHYNVQMFSTDTNNNDAEGAYPTDGYANDMEGMQGTSMSTPAVAGAANLLIEAMGGHQSWGYTATEAKRVKALLLMTATETFPLLRETVSTINSPFLNRGGKDVHEGYGRLNVDIAIEAYTQELALGATKNAWIASSFENSFEKHGFGCYVNLINGEDYVFGLDVPNGADFDLHLYSNNPSSIGEPIMIASSTSSGLGTDEIIMLTATETGKYYLVAKAISGEGNAIVSFPDTTHDLSVSLELPTTPKNDQTYIINATVTNTGSSVETNVDLFLYLDSGLVNSTTISNLPIGASDLIKYMWTPTESVKCNFTAYAPTVPGETFTLNNILTELITSKMTYFFEDFESGLSQWDTITGLWHLTDDGSAWLNPYHSPTHSMWFGNESTGNYNTGFREVGDLISVPIDLFGATDIALDFYHWREGEGTDNYDGSYVYISIDGINWDLLYYTDVDVLPWQKESIDISKYAGNSFVQLRFLIDSIDGLFNDYRGWLVDDIEIWGKGGYDHELKVSLEVPTYCEIDNTYAINATVLNNGENDETNIDLFLYLDDVLVDSITISSLLVGASESINYMWTPIEDGTYNFTAYASPVPGETYLENNIATELISVIETKLFDGMSNQYNFTIFNDIKPSTFTYSSVSGILFHVDWDMIDGGVPNQMYWDVNTQTRIMGNSGGGSFQFGDGFHTPIWIFTNVSLGDEILIAVDAEGDHLFNVSAELLYDLPGFGLIDVWVLEDLTLPGGVAWYEKSTGILLNGTFYYAGGLSWYTFDFIDTNAISFDHDLGVSLEVPINSEIDNTYTINATVTNTGENDEINIDLFLYLDDVLVDSITVSSLPVGASESINYMWTPTEPKTYNFTAYAQPVSGETHTIDNIATKLITISSLRNYTMTIDYASNWIDASGGTELLLSDDDYAAIPLPFDFQFYNETFSTIYLSSNGYLSFTDLSPSDFSNDPIPSGDLDNYYLIAPFWDDIYPPDGGHIYVQSFGTYWVAEWQEIYHINGPLLGSFEVVLYDTGEIIFNYDYLNYTTGGYTCGLNLGINIQYYNSYQGLNDLTDNFTILFTYLTPPSYFELSTNAGTPDDDGNFDLFWTSAAGAQNYSVYEYSSYITEINESLSLLGDNITDLSIALSGYTDGTYYFIAVAHNAYGDTLSNCIEIGVGFPPGDFLLSSNAEAPEDDGNFDLTWVSAYRAQNYSVYEYSRYITEINGSLTLLEEGTTDLSLAFNGYTNGTYYFIIVAHNDYGDTLSNGLEVIVEILAQPPDNFVLSSNAGSPDDDGVFDLSWTSASGAQNYSVYEYSKYITEINGSLTLLGTGITAISLALSGYTDGTYYFIIVAHNDYGDTLSNCINIFVANPPGNFVLSSNAGTPDDNGAFDLSWTSAVGGQDYSVYEYSKCITEINGSLTLLTDGITDLSLALSDYTDGTYYFIVVARNANGDTLSNCISVVVQLPSEPAPPAFGIPGYNLYVVISMICIVSIILFKKRYKLNNN